jgi:hypothetical protein
MMRYLCISSALFIAGCDAEQNLGKQKSNEGAVQTAPNAPKSPSKASSKLIDWTADGCSLPPYKTAVPVNRTEASLYESFGEPKYKDDFEFEKGLVYREREILLDVLSLPADAKRMVRQLTWEKSGCKLEIWLVEKQGIWTVIHDFETEPGAEF